LEFIASDKAGDIDMASLTPCLELVEMMRPFLKYGVNNIKYSIKG